MFDFIKDNLGHVAPLLIAGGFAVAIVFERSKALFQTYPIKDQEGFFQKITELVLSGKTGEAVALCDRYPMKPTARVVKQGLLRAHQPEALVEHGLQLAVAEVTGWIQKRTNFLATIANVATLLGLLGTIAGLIASFQAVGSADPQQKSALLAAGISTAMNATMMGLGIAIPCMVAFSFLINRSNKLVSDAETSAIQVLDILKQRYYGAELDGLRTPETDSGEGNQGAKVMPLRRAAA